MVKRIGGQTSLNLRRFLIALTLLLPAAAALLLPAAALAQTIIAHRGASGERPEHTLAAYELAIDQGADFIEPDLVPTKDGVLVARHENEISGTTDVARHRKFAARRTTRTIDGEAVTGWFTEDFTLAELRSLRAKERLPALRPANTRFDGRFAVPTLAEILALVKRKERPGAKQNSKRRIGIYPELKHPSYFASLGLDTPGLLLSALDRAGYRTKADPAIIQCFEMAPLARLRPLTGLRLAQLIAADNGPPDLPAMTVAAMTSPAGLNAIARYADAVGVESKLLVGLDGAPTGLGEAAHKAGLQIHVWTLRRENQFLPTPLRRGADPAAAGNYAAAWAILAHAGADAIFTDNPREAFAARRALKPK